MPAIIPRGKHSSNRVKYDAGVSFSSRLGIEGSFETGVREPPNAGEPWRGSGGEEFCRNRCVILNISPKLLRPLVEVEVRAEEAKYGGTDKSSWFSASDPMVDERPRFLHDGLDRTERAEFVESFRNRCGVLVAASPTVERDGDGSGETWSWPSEISEFGVSAGGNFGPLSIT
jgi:hypothetical protein